jgi:phosphoribosyl 1,2-cyclic phosphate phosphodiesterase
MVLLGCGTSVGVPTLGCPCPVCTSGHARNQRTRSPAIFGLPQGNLLIDTTPEMRLQLLRERIGSVCAVAYTHEHADHLFGLDDLRIFPFYLGHPVPIYCEPHVGERIRRTFDYAFADMEPTHAGATPQLELNPIGTDPFDVLGATVQPLRLQHGPRFQVLGFRVGKVAYCTDVSAIPGETWPRLAGLETLILGALRRRRHPTHFSLDEAVEAARRVGASQTYFTHLSHELDYEATNATLPPEIQLAYDGLRVPF